MRDRLALEALSKLSVYFVSKPDFNHLINTLLLIINGQFAVKAAFIAIGELQDLPEGKGFVATGRFLDDTYLSSSFQVWETARFPFTSPAACHIDDLSSVCTSPDVISQLREHGVHVLAPVMHDDRIIGVIGLGEKANGQTVQEPELELLSVMANTVAPLVINALYFHRTSVLGEWHVAVLNSVNQGVFVFDDQYRLRMLNSAGHRILQKLGVMNHDATGLEGYPFETIFPEVVFSDWQGRNHLRNVRKASHERVVTQAGDQKQVYDVWITKVSSIDGSSYHTVVTIEDVTRQNETENWLFELQKFADKGNMTAEIAHELNNFLAAISGSIEVAQHAIRASNSKKAIDVLDRLMANTKRIEQFGAGLMSNTAPTTTRSATDLNSLVLDVLSFIAPQKRLRAISVRKDLAADLVQLDIDAAQIAQVLINLINNASDAIAEIKDRQGEIVVSTRHRGSAIELTVTDNGTGMSQDVRDRLFNERLTTKPRGHGFGLVTCSKIIERHGGSVTVESEVGSGTSFTISLPAGNKVTAPDRMATCVPISAVR